MIKVMAFKAFFLILKMTHFPLIAVLSIYIKNEKNSEIDVVGFTEDSFSFFAQK